MFCVPPATEMTEHCPGVGVPHGHSRGHHIRHGPVWRDCRNSTCDGVHVVAVSWSFGVLNWHAIEAVGVLEMAVVVHKIAAYDPAVRSALHPNTS